MNENAISLQEAAAVLNLSYSTIFARRFEIGFRIPGSRIWRVWPSTLSNLSNQSLPWVKYILCILCTQSLP